MKIMNAVVHELDSINSRLGEVENKISEMNRELILLRQQNSTGEPSHKLQISVLTSSALTMI